MLLSSSELLFATSGSATANAANKSRQTTITTANMIYSFLYAYLNVIRAEKLYPLTVL